jgi:septum formation protein
VPCRAATIRAVPVDLVLASSSPRRRELLAWLDVPFRIDVVDVDESPRPGETAEALVRRLARAKGEAAAVRVPGAWIVAADTIVEIDGDVLGKPRDVGDAASMLARLSDREHRVHTAFVLGAPGGRLRAEQTVTSRVRFRRLSPAVIEKYVASGEPADKAGAYALQGRGAAFVAGVDGSLTNVIGLPLDELEQALAEAGILGG